MLTKQSASRCRRHVIVLSLSLAILLAACGGRGEERLSAGDTGPVRQSDSTAPARATGSVATIQAARTFGGGTRHLVPVSGVAAADVVSSAAALSPTDSAGNVVPPVVPATYKPTVVVASYTDDVMAKVDGAGKPTTQLYKDRLVWAVIYDHVSGKDLAPSGVPSPSGGKATNDPTVSYVVVSLVDARSGLPLLIIEEPEAP